MAKLYFRYGAMGSSKTANALMVRYNYLEKGKTPIILKPKIECRDGKKIIRSRIGLEAECEFVEDFILNKAQYNKYDAVIVDEAQFLSSDVIDQLAAIVDDYKIPVICYGLRTDFQGHFFAGSKRLMEIADVIEEIPTICWCGKKDQFNARVKNGKVIRDGDTVELGGNESYTSLCRKHYLSGELAPETK